jgi:hypothetical protein
MLATLEPLKSEARFCGQYRRTAVDLVLQDSYLNAGLHILVRIIQPDVFDLDFHGGHVILRVLSRISQERTYPDAAIFSQPVSRILRRNVGRDRVEVQEKKQSKTPTILQPTPPRHISPRRAEI